MANINEILAALNTYTESNAYDVFIPSLKRNVKFKPLTGKQQKAFYDCFADNIVFRTKFVILSYNTIKENCLEPNLVDSFNVIDRSAILLTIRKNALGSEFILVKDDKQYMVNIDDCLLNATKIETPQPKTVTTQNLEFTLAVPTILDQYNIEKQLRENSTETTVPMTRLVKDVLFSEASKFIKEIYLNKTPFNFSQLSYADRITVVEALPADALIQLQSYLKEVEQLQLVMLSVQLENNEVSAFDITPDFFLEG